MYFSNILTSSLNSYRILHVTHTKFMWGAWVLKPTIVAIAAISFAQMISSQIILVNPIMRMGFNILLCTAFYAFMIGGCQVFKIKEKLKMKV